MPPYPAESMEIKVLPYIDTTRLGGQAERSSSEAQTDLNRSGSSSRTPRTAASTLTKLALTTPHSPDGTSLQTLNSNISFQMTLATAQRTMEALTVDLIASQDKETIEKAAAILSASGNTQLQKLGQSLLNTEAGTGTPISGSTSSETAARSAAQTAAQTASSNTNPSTATGGTDASANSGSPDSEAAPVASQVGSSSSTGAYQAGSSSSTGAYQAGSSSSTDDSQSGSSSSTGAYQSGITSEAAQKASSVLGCPSSLEPYFAEASEKYGVDIALLEAIAKAESDFTSDAVSRAGATGVMQLMPATARELGVSDLYDAHENILGGAKEISSYLERYNGDLSLSLAAYNAGSGNVRKYGGIPPFKETQTYVVRVTDYYNSAKL